MSAGALLGALGGPVGLAVAAAGVAASFLLMKDGSDKVQPSIESQSKTVAELAEEYKKLEATQQRVLLREAIAETEDLTDAYKEQKNNLLGLVDAIRHNADVSDQSKAKAQALFEQYRQGKITAGQLATGINSLKDVSDSLKGSIDQQAGATNKAATELNKKNQVVQAYGGQVSSATILTDDITVSIKNVGSSASDAATEISGMTKAYKELLQTSQNKLVSLHYEQQQRQAGVSPELAKANADTVNQLNADPNSTQTYFRAPDDLSKANADEIAQKNKLAAMDEAERKRQEQITKEREKQNRIAQQTASVNSRVTAQAKQFNYAGIEQQYNLPSGILAAISMRESRGNPNAVSPKGAKGAFQFMPATATRFNLSNPFDVGASATAAAKYLRYLLNKFNGDLDKAIMAYNAGEGNMESGKAYRFKETREYLPAVKKYMAGYNGLNDENAQSDLNKMLAAQNDLIRLQDQADQNRISIKVELMTEPEKLKYEYDKLVEKIEKAGFDDTDKTHYLALAEQEYQNKLTKRPEIAKRVNDTVLQLNQDFLQQSGRGLEADLAAASQKYDQLKADISQLMTTESDPAQQQQYKSMLVRIDYIIDKEQLTLKFNDAMKRLDELQSLRQQRQDTLKLQFDSGQISQPQYAAGLQSIDTEMKPQLMNLVEVTKQLALNLDDAFSVAKIENFAAGLNQVDTESKKFLPTLGQIEEQIAGGMTDAMMSWIDGTKSAGDAFRQFASDFLREMAQMILKQLMFNAVKAATSYMGYSDGGLVTGFSGGGYTGAGGKYQEAGIVHKDEFVIRKESTSQHGAKEFLSYFNRYGMDALNKFNKGYADGGLVGAPNVTIPNIQAPKLNNPVSEIANSTSFNANQNFYLVDDPARILDVLKSGQGQENLVVMMSRDPAKFKSALKIG